MTAEQHEEMLMRILGLSDDAPLTPEGARARKRLRELLDASQSASLEDIAGYASELLDNPDQQHTLKQTHPLSERTLFEVEAARDFMASVEALTETAPAELVSAAIAAAREAAGLTERGFLDAIQHRWTLTLEQMQRLFAQPKLRENLRRALADLAPGPAVQMPALATPRSKTANSPADRSAVSLSAIMKWKSSSRSRMRGLHRVRCGSKGCPGRCGWNRFRLPMRMAIFF